MSEDFASMRSRNESVHVFPNLETLSRAAAQHVVAHMETVLSSHDVYTLALAGGSTPERLYELLATVYSGNLPWSKVHLFWGDERLVPPTHAKSNFRMVREKLLLDIDIPKSNVHPMPVGSTGDLNEADAVADAYAETLREHLPLPVQSFNCALLGLGGDGHTASLFPENDPSVNDEALVRAVDAPPRHDVKTRLTCTLPVLNRSEQALFLVSGANKREALRGVLDDRDPSYPATLVAPREQLSWFVDEDAR